MNRFCAVVVPPPAAELLVGPAVRGAGFEAVRIDPGDLPGANGESPSATRLRLCHTIVADVTRPSAGVTYELGRRDALASATVVRIAADERDAPPEDHALVYRTVDGQVAADESFVVALTARVRDTSHAHRERSVHHFLDDWPGLPHSKTDVFREEVGYDSELKAALRAARTGTDPVGELHRIERALGDLETVDAAVLVDLLLSYRAASAWDEMVAFVDRLPPLVAAQVLVREQHALALNRAGRSKEAEAVAKDVLAERGPSPETCSILGRIHKDQMRAALAAGDDELAARRRHDAIDAYLRGFETDWRDAYPGINAVQLIHGENPDDPRLDELIPIVQYAIRRKLDSGPVDYWDHATLVELAVLDHDEHAARSALVDALDADNEPWMRETTADTLTTLVELGAPSFVPELVERLRGTDPAPA